MAAPTEITIAQLSRLIGTPDAPVIIDVRTDEDFDAEPTLVPTAFRRPHGDMLSLAPELSGRRATVVCHRGLKLSQGAAALLRAEGVQAETLAGGMVAYCASGAPRVPAAAMAGAKLWVTRHRPKIDRIACPWLVRRFVMPDARILFVAPSEVLDVADRFGATPFDVEDVFWSHENDQCTFDKMLRVFGLETEPLLRLATVVRGADTNRADLAPQSAGLLAASVGLSRMYRDDIAQLDAGMQLYDAFYRWARDGFDEGHDWPPGKA